MTEYDNTNRGAIWPNKKQGNNRPEFTGELNVNGVGYWVSAWKRKEGASPNAPSLSFQIEEKEQKQARDYADNQTGGIANKPQEPADDGFSDIPF